MVLYVPSWWDKFESPYQIDWSRYHTYQVDIDDCLEGVFGQTNDGCQAVP